ncbi:MAG TPA: hypothetical protein VGZ00_08065 [Candidatus Baltobacteraceae bacterium]|nr:hypothetical protein [Candidatus Baltobacteraceae bacterium]
MPTGSLFTAFPLRDHGPVHLDFHAIGCGESDQLFSNLLLSDALPKAEILKAISSTHLSSSVLQQL